MPNSSKNNILPRKSPECPFVLKEKGKQFVEESKALPSNPRVKNLFDKFEVDKQNKNVLHSPQGRGAVLL